MSDMRTIVIEHESPLTTAYVAKVTGLHPESVRQRHRHGETLESILATGRLDESTKFERRMAGVGRKAPPANERPSIHEEEISAMSMSDLSRLIGVSRQRIHQRIKKGQSIASIAAKFANVILADPENPFRKEDEPLTITEVSRRTTLCRRAVYDRHKRGESLQEILATGRLSHDEMVRRMMNAKKRLKST